MSNSIKGFLPLMLSVITLYVGKAIFKAGSPINVKLRLLLLFPDAFLVLFTISPKVKGEPSGLRSKTLLKKANPVVVFTLK